MGDKRVDGLPTGTPTTDKFLVMDSEDDGTEKAAMEDVLALASPMQRWRIPAGMTVTIPADREYLVSSPLEVSGAIDISAGGRLTVL